MEIIYVFIISLLTLFLLLSVGFIWYLVKHLRYATAFTIPKHIWKHPHKEKPKKVIELPEHSFVETIFHEKNTTQRCPYCGATNSGGAVICKYCKNNL